MSACRDASVRYTASMLPVDISVFPSGRSAGPGVGQGRGRLISRCMVEQRSVSTEEYSAAEVQSAAVWKRLARTRIVERISA